MHEIAIMNRMKQGIGAAVRACAGAVLAALILGAPLAAQAGAEAEPGAAVEERFEVLPLSDGIVLRPRADGAGFKVVEIRGDEIAIDGVPVSADELRARLGEDADSILDYAGRLAAGEAEQGVEAEAGAAGAAAEAAGAAAAAAAGKVSSAVSATVEEAVERAEEAVERAERETRRHRKTARYDEQVVVGSSVTIEEDEVARDVVVIGGSLTVLGKVRGDAVAVGGSIEIDGEVTGDVAAIGGSVGLEETARVEGDVVAVGGSVERASGAVVGGEIEEVPLFPSLRIGGWDRSPRVARRADFDLDVSPVDTAFRLAWGLFGLGLLLLLTLVTVWIAPNVVARIGARAEAEPFKAGLVGLLCQILFLPLLIVVIVVLVISIVGIPLLLLVPFALVALVLVALLGYAAVTLKLGRWAERRFGWNLAGPLLAVLVGFGLIQIWSLIGDLLAVGPGPIKFFAVMFGLFGGLVCYLAWTIGFGAAVLSRFGSAGGWAAGARQPEQWQSVPPAPPGAEPPIEAEPQWPYDDGEPRSG